MRGASRFSVNPGFAATAAQRGRPAVIRADNHPEFCGNAMLTWAHRNSVALQLIEPGKPNQNAYIESLNGRLREESLNEHWFTSLAHARSVIEAWRSLALGRCNDVS
jgi:putative transposase